MCKRPHFFCTGGCLCAAREISIRARDEPFDRLRTSVVSVLLIAAGIFLVGHARARAQTDLNHWTASLANIRTTAALVPGRRPLRVNILKFAESRRTKNFSIKGAPADPSVQ